MDNQAGPTDVEDATAMADETDEVASYGVGDLSDTVSLWFIDPWPANKSLAEYHLIYFDDPELEDPIVLQNRRGIPIPEDSALVPYDDFATTQLEDTTVRIGRGVLVFPDLGGLIDDEYLRPLPETMQGTIINRRNPDDNEFLEHLISEWLEAQD